MGDASAPSTPSPAKAGAWERFLVAAGDPGRAGGAGGLSGCKMNGEFGVRGGGGVETLPEPVGFATRWWCRKTSGAEGAGAVNGVTAGKKGLGGEGLVLVDVPVPIHVPVHVPARGTVPLWDTLLCCPWDLTPQICSLTG